jgi:hypothetical protein
MFDIDCTLARNGCATCGFSGAHTAWHLQPAFDLETTTKVASIAWTSILCLSANEKRALQRETIAKKRPRH